MNILINTIVTAEHCQQIQALSDQVRIVQTQDHQQLLQEIVDTDIVFGGLNLSLFEKAQQLKWLQVLGAGVDGVLFPELVKSDVILTSAKGIVGTHLADQTWALLLGLLRGIGRSVRERTWENRMSIRHSAWELRGRTLGIVGLGGTGIEVARRAQGFEMRTIAVDRSDGTNSRHSPDHLPSGANRHVPRPRQHHPLSGLRGALLPSLHDRRTTIQPMLG